MTRSTVYANTVDPEVQARIQQKLNDLHNLRIAYDVHVQYREYAEARQVKEKIDSLEVELKALGYSPEVITEKERLMRKGR